MGVFKIFIAQLVAFWIALSSTVTAVAHEVQPGIMDIAFRDGVAEVQLQWVIEAPLAGLDLEGVEDTDQAQGAEQYDELRALTPAKLEEMFRNTWPDLQQKMAFRVDGQLKSPNLVAITVPDEPDLELSRTATLRMDFLVDANAELKVSWANSFGPLIVRNADLAFAEYLTNGAVSVVPLTEAKDETAVEAFVSYIRVGFDHIIPLGLDHILFVLGLFFLSTQMRPLLWQITAFTLAHTVTLALGALEILRLPGAIVEPLIAASIVYVGVENLLFRRLTPWRPVVVFCFGLLHGLGFASVLADFGLGESHFIPKLIGFNLGVEIGQLAVVGAAFLTFAVWFGRKDWYFAHVAAPVSVAISLVGLFWVVERTGLADLPWAEALLSGELPLFMIALAALVIAAVFTATARLKGLGGISGFLTSFLLFFSLLSLFSSGFWAATIGCAFLWVLALFLQGMKQ